ncbi:MAG: type VI secretion system ATPase TssH [Planctomycetes bacterium]|nr:type VI secretion system ATPase TssH [Planctomycetota bacterium]
MSEIKRTELFGRLSPLAYKAIESATVLCKMRSNPYVELAHWLTQIAASGDSDLHRILRRFEIDPSRLAADLTAALERLPRGATSISDFSPHIEHAIKEGWMWASLKYREGAVRSGHILLGCVRSKSLSSVLDQLSKEFAKIKGEALSDELHAICKGSPEEATAASGDRGLGGTPGEASGAMAPAAMGKQEALKRFTVDLTQRARDGQIDPVVGRDDEIRLLIDILMRRRQNNPILTGEAGVGKTAVVEGFAQRVAAGDVPPALKDITLRSLDMALLQAGASMKGEFEERLKQVIEEVQGAEKPVILFIDEAHTLIGAGGSAGTGDAANLLKPALARGTLRTIGATTWAEYKKYFEKDPALTRRFQVVQVDEPDDAKAQRMLRGTVAKLEKHHKILVLEEAVAAAVTLSRRFIPARQLPDKAVSLLDTACARVGLSQGAEPAGLERLRRDLEALAEEQAALKREGAIGADHGKRLAELGEREAKLKTEQAAAETRYQAEKKLVATITAARTALAAEACEGREARLAELKAAEAELVKLQGEAPLVLPAVDAQAVAVVVGEWTGIPLGRMVKDEVKAVLGLADTLRQRVRGQDHAMDIIATRIQTARAGLGDPVKPIGVIMLAGPSGVGKTETALTLAETLYGGDQSLITINMSEFQESHTVSTLKGAPPGYVGYGEGGVLTEAVRRKPYSVVLLDEVEKAHPDVHKIFFQVFDKGWMEDGEGRGIDFRNTVIILTTNVGSDEVIKMCKDPELLPAADAVGEAIRPALRKTFPDALLGRIQVVPYYPLAGQVLTDIINLKLAKVQKRVQARYQVPLTIDAAVPTEIARRANQLESGARMIDAIIANHLLPKVSAEFLTRTMEGQPFTAVALGVEGGEFAFKFT